MNGQNKAPRYAVRLVLLVLVAAIIFFGGLQLFVPEGSKLTGSYDASSLLYIASAPVAFSGSESCGAVNCHEALFKQWSEGAHGARKEQSKCEVCHGPKGAHPEKETKLPKVRGDGDIVELCLSCHRKLKARSSTGQPQISPQEHPYPHEGVLKCIQCHNPHSPALGKAKAGAGVAEGAADTPPIASNCFSCHGASGRGGFAPVLAGQSYEALKDKLTKFRAGEITSPMMNPVAKDMKDDDIETLARYFSGLGSSTTEKSASSDKTVEGATDKAAKSSAVEAPPPIASNCFSCHGASGRGGFAPVLAGQSYDALKDKLTKYKSGELNNPMMSPVAAGMKDEDIETLAQYFSGLS